MRHTLTTSRSKVKIETTEERFLEGNIGINRHSSDTYTLCKCLSVCHSVSLSPLQRKYMFAYCIYVYLLFIFFSNADVAYNFTSKLICFSIPFTLFTKEILLCIRQLLLSYIWKLWLHIFAPKLLATLSPMHNSHHSLSRDKSQ